MKVKLYICEQASECINPNGCAHSKIHIKISDTLSNEGECKLDFCTTAESYVKCKVVKKV